MAGPSGVDVPAQAVPPSRFRDGFRAFSAFVQGDPDRAETIIAGMPVEEFSVFRRVLATLHWAVTTEGEARDRASLLASAGELMPACTCPPRRVRHEDRCPRRAQLGSAAPMRSGLSPEAVDG